MAKRDDNIPSTAEDVMTNHAFAKGLYDEANTASDKVLDMLTEGVEIPSDAPDAGNAMVAQMVMARALIERMRQMLQVDASLKPRVMPQKAGEQERERCAKIERCLKGYDRRHAYETKRNYHRDATFWYLLRGRCVLETRVNRAASKTGQLPFSTFCDDPNTIFPVRGRSGVLWYTKEYSMFAREAKRAIQYLKVKQKPEFPEEPNATVDVVEFYDDKYYACVFDGKTLVHSVKHDLGFVPMSEGHCMDTPLEDARWAYQAVIGPVVDHIKLFYILVSKMATGVNEFYFPRIYYKSISGKPIVFDPGAVGQLEEMAPDGKFEVVSPDVNSQIIGQLLGVIKGDISLMTLPETAFGAEPQSLESGFAVAQVLGQVQSAIADKVPNLARCFADHYGNLLRMVAQLGGADGMDLSVPDDLE